jgi:serine/threonine-protein kinase
VSEPVTQTLEEARRLVNAAAARGLLTPPQANQALRLLREKAASGAPLSLGELLVKDLLIPLKRWEIIARVLGQPAAAPVPSPAMPTPVAAPVTPPAIGEAKLALPKAEAPVEPRLPFTLGGYRLLEKIGQGGMALVYKAQQIELRRTVAVKLLPANLARDQVFVERFRREARAAAALNHPNIVLPIHVGADRGYHFIAMEFVEGESLQSWVEREGRLHWRAAVEMVLQVGRGLEHAHAHSLIHRDIKPENILIDRHSRLAKIADLGLARRAGEDSKVGADSLPMGTPHYISPEQVRGQTDLDGRADIYSLGATFWHSLVGVPPYDGPSAAVVMAKHLTDPIPDPLTSVPDLPDGPLAVLYKMMARERRDRYQSCAELCVDLECLLANRPPKYAPPAPRAGRTSLPGANPRLGPSATRRPGASRLREPAAPSASRAPYASRYREPRPNAPVAAPRPSLLRSRRFWLLMLICAAFLGIGMGLGYLLFGYGPVRAPPAKSSPAGG